MSRSRPTAFPFAPVLVVLVLVASTSVGQAPATDLDRFRALDPAQRLRIVEGLPGAKDAFQAAARGDLIATVIERGSLDAATAADVSCQVKARKKDAAATTIKWVVEDGTVVKKGDRLVELDDSGLRDEIVAATVQARKAATAATSAAEEVQRTRRADEILVRLAEIDVQLAEAELKQPPPGQTKQVLELKVERAKLQVEKVKDEAKTRQARAEADERERATEAKSAADRLRDLETERTRCVLTAPFDGFAVYSAPPAGRFGGPPAVIAAGEPVKEGQKLVRVVNLTKMLVGTRVHEAQISTVRVGQPVRVRVDAYPGKVLPAKVSQVSTTAAAPDFGRSDIKVYPVTVALDESLPGLKPSMSAEVRIETRERKGVILVPLRAVLGTGRVRSCFVKEGEKLVEREVTTGPTDGTSVEITAGLQAGDMVLADPSAVLTRSQPRK